MTHETPPLDLTPALDALRARLDEGPEIFLVLGSGLGGLTEGVEDPLEIPFEEIPGFPSAGVAGHKGRYVAGTLEGRRVLMQAGRYHFYEGYGAEVVTAPVRLARLLGVQAMLLTNAAGGIDRNLRPGDLLLLDDHINLQWRSPLAGPVKEGEDRFPDMSAPYDLRLQELALEVAREQGIPLHRGTYAAVPGPSYETPAEIRMLERVGADAVGMSTVPEVIAARAGGLPLVAISLITNQAAGLGSEPLSHQEVLEVGCSAGRTMERLVRGIVAGMGDQSRTGAK